MAGLCPGASPFVDQDAYERGDYDPNDFFDEDDFGDEVTEDDVDPSDPINQVDIEVLNI